MPNPFFVLRNFLALSLTLASVLFIPAVMAVGTSADSLASHPYWLQLGHYRRAMISDWKSEIDTDTFFIAQDGKRDPLAELQATLAIFENAEHPQYNDRVCDYPARFQWLKEKLQAAWSPVECPEMEQWREIIQPQGMTLVFPTSFMNNPSSMFGHTLIRIDARDQTRNKELVAFAVNFAANPDSNDNAAVFAFNGMVGRYPAAFSLMPYYRKVREYNDLESRDIWEYKLKLTEQEVDRILLHIWELKDVNFDYYFLDENCSYQLLSLLQLARDDLDLTSEFPYHVIPSDTVAALRDKNLLTAPNYRAAFGTKLLHYSAQLTEAQLNAAKWAKAGDYPSVDDYTEQERAAILEMAYEWLNYQFYDEGLDRKTTAPQLRQLLYERSKIKTPSPFSPVMTPEVAPEKGHGSSRLGLAFTGFDDHDNTAALSWRIAYHDLFDSPGGFIAGAQISFFDTELSLSEQGTLRLERFYIIDAMSLAPDNRVFDSLAWNIRTGFDRQPDPERRSERWFVQGGYGKSWGDPNKLHGYLLASAELNAGDIAYRSVDAGVGVESGLIWQASLQHKLGVTGQYTYLIDSDTDTHYRAQVHWQWSPLAAWGLRAEGGYLKWRAEDVYGKLTAFYYF